MGRRRRDTKRKASSTRAAAPREDASPRRRDEGPPRSFERPAWLTLPVALAILVVVQIVAIRLQAIPAPHTGGDNAAYIGLAHDLQSSGSYTDAYLPGAPPHTKYPPVFAFLLASVIALGAKSWVALKWIPQLFTVLFAMGVFFWARRRHGSSVGLGLGLLTVLAPAILDASNWILTEPPFLAFTFLALWALDRTRGSSPGGGKVKGDPSFDRMHRRSNVRFAVGLVAVGLAYFTRSAGLPLVVATLLLLLFHARWRSLALFGLGFGAPAALWSLRGRAAQGNAYVSEFWLVDPYQPDLGGAGPWDLVQRLIDNVWLYVGEFIPNGMAGVDGRAATALGFALCGFAVAGWVFRVRSSFASERWRGIGITEWFVPLYVGLILVWPSVWSGERFALPLYPIVLLYAGEALATLARGRGAKRTPAVLLLAGVVLLLPAVSELRRSFDLGRGCRQAVVQAGPYGCWSSAVQEFVALAVWSGENLPEEAVVLNRKPRIFHVMSAGLAGDVFPFTETDGALFESVNSLGATHVLLDRWDLQAARFVLPVLAAHPERFCVVTGFQAQDGGLSTGLLRVLPESALSAEEAVAGQSLQLCSNPSSDAEAELTPYLSDVIPLLSGSALSSSSGSSP